MKKTIGRRLLSGVTAMLVAASSLSFGAFAVDGLDPAADPDQQRVEVLVKDPSDPNKVQVTDKSTLLVGDGVLFETEPATFKGKTLADTIANYDKHYALGIASQFCVFLSEDFTPMQSDAEGRVAVGKDINVKAPNGWGGYAVGKGDYVTSETLDHALGKVESPGYAHIIMGGQINNNYILSESYSGTNTRKLVINDTSLGSRSTTYLPEAITEGKIDQSQTYVTKLIDFTDEYRKLGTKSGEWAAKKPDGTAKLDSNGHFVFTYDGEETDEKEYVYFTIEDTDWDKYQNATYIDFVNIPQLPTALYGTDGRVLMDYDKATGKLEESHWYNSFIIINVLGSGEKHLANMDYDHDYGQKYTTINGDPVSREQKSDPSYWNNHIGTSSILYNFPSASKVIIGNNFQGTIFAPYADITDEWYLKYKDTVDDPSQFKTNGQENIGANERGHLSGSLIAKSFEGGTEFGYRTFAGLASTAGKYAVETSKVDTKDELLAGATLKLEKLVEDENGTIEIDGKKYKREVVEDYKEIKTSDEKKTLLENLEPGYYILSETKAPKGYQETDKEFCFEISEGDSDYAEISVDGVYEKPVIYEVVSENADPTGRHTILREHANGNNLAYGVYIPVTPKNEDTIKYYTWDSWSQIFYDWVDVSTQVSSVKFYYKNAQPREYTNTAQNSGGVWSIAGDNSWRGVITGLGAHTDVEYVTIKIRLNTTDSTMKKDLKVGLQYGNNPAGQPEVTLKDVTNTYKEYVVFGVGDPTEYYKLDSNSTVVRNGQKVEGTSVGLTTIDSSTKGKLTIYEDSTFTTVEQDDEGEDKAYDGTPYNIENNVYTIKGKNFVFKNSELGYHMYYYDEQGEDDLPVLMEDWGVELQQVLGSNGDYVVFEDGVIVDPMQLLTKPMDADFGFKVVNRPHIYFEKTDVLGTNIEGATFELAAKGATVDWSKVYKVEYKGEEKILTALGSGTLTLGDIEIEGLPDGTYTLVETQAPSENYDKFGGTLTFEVKDGLIESYSVDPADLAKMVTVDKDGNKISVYNAESDKFTINKQWADNKNANGTRPNKVKLTITGTLPSGAPQTAPKIEYKVEVDGTMTDAVWSKEIITSSEVTAPTKDDKTGTITLPMYYYDEVEETVDGETVTTKTKYKYTYTVSEAKDDVPELYESSQVNDLTVKNTLKDETTISGKKIWKNDDDFMGLRPKSVTIRLLANGTKTDKSAILNDENEWKYSFTGLDKYDSTGKEITYTITEDEVENYDPTITKTSDGYDITNTCTFKQEYDSIKGEKKWVGDEEFSGLRPESITVQLKKNGVVYKTLTVTPGEDGKWTYEFTNLPKFNENGEANIYTVTELPVDNYTGKVDGYNITNTLDVGQEYVDISGLKTWKDDDNYFGSRPDSIEIILYANGEEVERTSASKESGWKYEFTHQPKYDSSYVKITYTVKEVAVDGYTAVITGYNIENTYDKTQSYTEISGKKTWVDDDDSYGLRPTSVTIKLYANGSDTGKTATANKSNNWTYKFSDLPVLDSNGDKITYTVDEVDVEGYKKTKNGYDFTNTYDKQDEEDKTVSVKIDKRDIANDEEVVGAMIQIFDKDGNEVASWESDGKIHTVEGLVVGEEYTLHEVSAPDGYEKISQDITFTVGEDGNVTVTSKSVWDDETQSGDAKTDGDLLIVNDAKKSDDGGDDSSDDSGDDSGDSGDDSGDSSDDSGDSSDDSGDSSDDSGDSSDDSGDKDKTDSGDSSDDDDSGKDKNDGSDTDNSGDESNDSNTDDSNDSGNNDDYGENDGGDKDKDDSTGGDDSSNNDSSDDDNVAQTGYNAKDLMPVALLTGATVVVVFTKKREDDDEEDEAK